MIIFINSIKIITIAKTTIKGFQKDCEKNDLWKLNLKFVSFLRAKWTRETGNIKRMKTPVNPPVISRMRDNFVCIKKAKIYIGTVIIKVEITLLLFTPSTDEGFSLKIA